MGLRLVVTERTVHLSGWKAINQSLSHLAAASREIYPLAKFTDWGDLLPVEWPENRGRWLFDSDKTESNECESDERFGLGEEEPQQDSDHSDIESDDDDNDDFIDDNEFDDNKSDNIDGRDYSGDKNK
ncbi:hypothetical protein FSP39_017468 [Pinctada imbricata]|uniref:Uncharacterized protein n=1 Tax=Pinctada imbricata TaxID=66713 RepID=A0AA89BM78_PINIB|nr:hypothetical protein FSP39_017468 [Pinctada imbricata]